MCGEYGADPCWHVHHQSVCQLYHMHCVYVYVYYSMWFKQSIKLEPAWGDINAPMSTRHTTRCKAEILPNIHLSKCTSGADFVA
mmetsp:Transcript_26209/g.47241  ORF Transcript_26209/g.47241 Transcript_26209/m.47241 type:complete len:84 (-) Transcript_26209:127-378(-)